MTVTLKQIEFYEAVCQAGNVTAAAQQLYVSRSVISRAIQELEDELDIQLFVRGRNGMELTEYGKTLRNLLSQFKGFYSALLAQISSLKETGENHSLTLVLQFPAGMFSRWRYMKRSRKGTHTLNSLCWRFPVTMQLKG